MRTIGVIDYYLDEWHANNFPQWIRENCALNGRDCDIAYAWAETDKADGMNSAQWCEKHGVAWLSSIQELVDRSDCIIVFSPDHPEHHERLARAPLMSGKPVYIDKTFSPDYATGARMFALAEQYGTPVFSSSALRFGKELSGYLNEPDRKRSIRYVATAGSGSFANYSVHQLEMIVALMGPGVRRVKSLSSDQRSLLALEYEDGRKASLHQAKRLPYQISLDLEDGESPYITNPSDVFKGLIHAMLDFFESGNPPVAKEETLAIMALIDAGKQALQHDDEWIPVQAGTER